MKVLVDRIKDNRKIFNQKALLTPYSKEIRHLIDSNLSIVKPKGIVPIGICDNKYSLEVITNISNAQLDSYDCIIAGYLSELSSLKNTNYLELCIKKALEHDLDLFSFENILDEKYRDYLQEAERKKLAFYSPYIDDNEYNLLRSMDLPNIERFKHLMVLGTGSNQGKFTLTLKIMDYLNKFGISHYSIGSEHHSELFGMDLAFPYGISKNIKIPVQNWPELLELYKKYLFREQREIMVSASQAGILNYAIQEKIMWYQNVPTVSFYIGLEPSHVVIVFNPEIDTIEFIAQTIRFIMSFHKTKILALCFSNRKNNKQKTKFTDEEIVSIKQKYIQLFSIKTFCINEEQSIIDLIETIIKD